ncbi:exodeoxyribonuclease V subunit beta [Corallincola platygyrae]|uniref:RecBCD enzyme subunit RecB n=1 Tax=Corallincola platygyrae TaxID=1193278 RepID=A0ABW4XT48_9GAMM
MMQDLNALTLPLAGRHLIEASAGTGKTYNITRLYLRLLLERELPVQQILVMTFTKAATQEIKGRIDSFLREALAALSQPKPDDDFIAALVKRVDAQRARNLLKVALLELDEAAIFTIHGFCQRALKQQAFDSGIAMELNMEADTSDLLMESVRDWFRLINRDEQAFNQLAEHGWHTPEAFYDKFRSALYSRHSIIAADEAQVGQHYESRIHQAVQSEFGEQKQSCLTLLQSGQAEIFSLLVDGHKDAAGRQAEWAQIIEWLEAQDATPCPKAVGDFINGNRYRKAEMKEVLLPLFEPLKALRTEFGKLLTKAVSRRDSQLSKVPAYQLAVAGISEIRRRFSDAKQRAAVMDFDDLISTLSDQLQSAESQNLVTALRAQYPVALVDEFQDTDPSQYAIFDTLYPKADPHHLLLMIGDPKQAIYAFRGGDIFTYLSARDGADYQWKMDTNWRSIAHVVTGYNRLFWGQPLEQESPADVFGYQIGYERIEYTYKAKANATPLTDSAERAALNYLWLSQEQALRLNGVVEDAGDKNQSVSVTAEQLMQGMAQSCVGEIARLLAEARLGKQLLQEKDIAILVRRGAEAEVVQQALQQAGYKSVYLSEKEYIFSSPEAMMLQAVLNGILECESDSLLTAALATDLMGGSAELLAKFRQPEYETLWEQQRAWAESLKQLWLDRSCMTMLLELIHNSFRPQPERHERALTNVLHLAELLQQASRQHKHPQQLLKWFNDQCQQQSGNEEAQLRLESDANLIRIVTMHGSKGLEYPVVFIPFASHYKDPVRFRGALYDYYEYHQPDTGEATRLLGQHDEAIALTASEGEAESIRLLYVAVTRAAHRCYIGVAPFRNSARSPLGLTLKLEGASAGDSVWADSLSELVNTSRGSSAWLPAEQLISDMSESTTDSVETQLPQAQRLQREIDDNWSLSSFSGLVRNAPHQKLSNKERSDDEMSPVVAVDRGQLPLRFRLRKGADAGNLLHDILEHTDFAQPHWEWSLQAPVQRFGKLEEAEVEELQAWLEQCLHAAMPILSQAPSDDSSEPEQSEQFCLADVSWGHTLREAEFYFPMAGVSLTKLADCLQQHRANQLPVFLPGTEQLQGMMHGFIDLIFEYQGRFYVADYKSTHLGDSYDDYHFDALKQNNQEHYYDLQYLLYSVALHRYLKVRLPDYDPALHLGGVYYLYLRGMTAEAKCASADIGSAYPGVFYAPIDIELLTQMDQLFASDNQEVPA